jgi:formylglycine-generating enzyme required for sulfatase activity
MFSIFRKKAKEPSAIALESESIRPVILDQEGRASPGPEASMRFFREALSDSVAIKMALVPAGSFVMGSATLAAAPDERPPHHVNIKAFYLSQAEVTQSQWKAVMGSLPPCRGKTMEHPVDRVSWTEALLFCQRLSARSGRPYRLPSESEWEYACRAGSVGDFSFGGMISTDAANYVGRHRYGNGPEGVYRHGSLPPGSFPPNPFGLYDMHGNLDEWCMDLWHDDYSGAPSDGSPWLSGASRERVIRGGSWHDPPGLLRSSARLKADPDFGEDFIGLRVALS